MALPEPVRHGYMTLEEWADATQDELVKLRNDVRYLRASIADAQTELHRWVVEPLEEAWHRTKSPNH